MNDVFLGLIIFIVAFVGGWIISKKMEPSNINARDKGKVLNIADIMPCSCSTCEHRKWYKCTLSGYRCSTERKYPTRCRHDYKGWKPRLGLFARLEMFFYGA